MDLALLVESRAPWYPPGNVPKGAEIVAIGENPLKSHMVYQTMHAGHYLEGDVAATLSAARRGAAPDRSSTRRRWPARRERWAAAHKKWQAGLEAAEEQAAGMDTITVPLLMQARCAR